jgi:hypothetical protein
MKDPIDISFTMCAFLKYWAGLYNEKDAERIQMTGSSQPATFIATDPTLLIEGP